MLAETSDIFYSRAMDHAYMLHVIREDKKSGGLTWRGWISNKEKLRDGQVKLGAVRHEQFAGSQRQMVNQMRTGTVSRHMLLIYSREDRSTDVYPVCKDDDLSTNHYSQITR
jgi:hypothetical protein